MNQQRVGNGEGGVRWGGLGRPMGMRVVECARQESNLRPGRYPNPDFGGNRAVTRIPRLRFGPETPEAHPKAFAT